jgi:large subunit ribosomal protein L21
MFAIIKTGGKQYKIKENDIIFVEKIKNNKGDKIDIKDVLLLSNDKTNIKVGTPFLKGITIKAEVLEQKKDKKVIVFKKKRRKNYRRKNGHRQEITVLKILKIGSKLIEKK